LRPPPPGRHGAGLRREPPAKFRPQLRKIFVLETSRAVMSPGCPRILSQIRFARNSLFVGPPEFPGAAPGGAGVPAARPAAACGRQTVAAPNPLRVISSAASRPGSESAQAVPGLPELKSLSRRHSELWNIIPQAA